MSSLSTFDSEAAVYDERFTKTAVGKLLRDQVHERLKVCFHQDDFVLELGSGTGEDAMFLAQHRVQVVATDASDAMLDVARVKVNTRFTTAQTRSVRASIRFERLDLNDLPDDLSQFFKPQTIPFGARPFGAGPQPRFDPGSRTQFDGVFSNFGPLNCISDWRPLARWLAACIKPGGIAAFGVMSPLCLWEVMWHGFHGDLRTATRRLRPGATFQNSAGQKMAVYYPSVTRLQRDFAPWFRRVHLQGVGLALPPSDVYGVVEKRPALLHALTAVDRSVSAVSALAVFADHYWIEFERY